MVDSNNNNEITKRLAALKIASAKQVCSMLNDLIAVDPSACRTLLSFHAYCNPDLINHPTIQVTSSNQDKLASIGIIGVVNGVLATLGIPRLISLYLDGTLVGFGVNENDYVIDTQTQNDDAEPSSQENANDGEENTDQGEVKPHTDISVSEE